MTSGYRMVAQHRPAELFRADLISAMKLPDSVPMESGSFLTIKDPWRTEWEVGVQVCVSPDQILEPNTRPIDDPPERQKDFRMPPTWCTEENTDQECVQYDLDDLDLNWLEAVNQKRKFRALAGSSGLSEESLREAILTLETMCQQNMAHAVTTEQTLGIEYDEHTVCDVCRDAYPPRFCRLPAVLSRLREKLRHESEEANDILFCDSCNICVHQACYGVQSIPRGDWMCKACSADGYDPTCVLCPNPGGALKRVRPGNSSWAHLNCALWIPEVRVGNVEKMEPITNVEAVPISRWNLLCCVCRKKQGACIQCSHPSCVTAYHVTCAFQHGLEMKARLELISNGVIHESYCPKHTVLRKSPSKLQSPRKTDINKSTQLLQVQEEFYKYTSPQDLRDELKLSPKLSTLIYNYWKLKRRSFHNRSLLSHLPIETAIDSIKAELTLGSQYGLGSDQTFGKIVHLRQNLEKARNLVYMVQRRERLKKQLLRSEVDAFEMESQLLEEELEEEIEAEEEEEQCMRQTRSMTQTQEMDKETTGTVLPAPPTCNHVNHPPTMNGPTNGSNSSPETSKESSPVPQRNLRKKDCPKVIPFDENHLLRKSIRRRFSDSIVMDDSLTGGGNGLLGNGPALNLRYRPYSVCKSTKS